MKEEALKKRKLTDKEVDAFLAEYERKQMRKRINARLKYRRAKKLDRVTH